MAVEPEKFLRTRVAGLDGHWEEAHEGELWYVRFKGYQWPLRECLIDEIIEGSLIKLISVDSGALAVDGRYEHRVDVDLVYRIDNEQSS